MAEQDGPRSEAERPEQPEDGAGGARGAVRPGGTPPDAAAPESGAAEPAAPEPAVSEPALTEPAGDGAAGTAAEPVAPDAAAEPGAPAQDPAVPHAEPSGAQAGAQPAAEAAPDAPGSPQSPQAPDEGAPAPRTGGAQRPAATPDDPAFDEEAAWAAIVAGYGEEPPDPPGAKPFKPIEDLLLPDPDPSQGPAGDPTRRRKAEPAPGNDAADGRAGTGSTGSTGSAEGSRNTESRRSGEDGTKDGGAEDGEGLPRPGRPIGGSVAFAPGVGPRDYRTADPADDDFDADDEGHFVPPEPPPLPSGDTTARFGWLAVLGGPLLLLLSVLLGWEMTWWLATLGIGGFVGGFGTLVVRMNPGDEDDDDPGRGAVV